MPKICPRCGYVNPDDANYCVKCGYPLSPQPPSPLQPDRLTTAFNIFTKNLSLILPPIIMLIIELVLAGILAAITVGIFFISPTAALVTALIFSVILGIVYALIFSITVHTTTFMAQDSARGIKPNTSSAFGNAMNTLSKLSSIIIVLVILGLLLGFTRFLGVLWIVLGLAGIPLFIISSATVLNRPMSLTEAINWYSRAFNVDGAASAVILVGSLLSLIPIVNIFTIPYTAILTYIMVRDIS
ncbi:zinc ribbon domain-containing protein [Sulfolobus islandicus]|nr:zinc ribbon domain-containing protein [Sulfolobus islandicus]